ncbi:MAG TPA: amino acid ABC transporter permease [Chloroflexia bacterium]|nr:amino acid ABC transporter permease [Chloroflexia bacterium]
MAAPAQPQVTQPPRPGINPGSLLALPLQVLGALFFVVAIPLAFGMEWKNFVPLFHPDSVRFLAWGVIATAGVSLVAIVLSLPLATGLALGRLARNPALRWPCVAFIEVVRAVPLLLLIFYINLRVPGLTLFENAKLGDPDSYTTIELTRLLSHQALAVGLALTIYTAAVNAELLRAGILSLDRGQDEAARSLGLSYWQTMRLVILPQAFQRTLAPLIAQFTILLKDTSLGSIIGFVELQRRAQILFERDFNPMEALFLVALIYFVLNYVLGLSSKLVERRRPTSVKISLSEV